MLRAVLFDLDDTLLDQVSAAGAAVEAWAAEHGIADADVRQRWAVVSEANFVRYSRRELTFAQQRRARVRESMDVEIDDAEADEGTPSRTTYAGPWPLASRPPSSIATTPTPTPTCRA